MQQPSIAHIMYENHAYLFWRTIKQVFRAVHTF